MGFFHKELLYVIVLMFGSAFGGTSLPYYSSVSEGIRADLKWSESQGTWFSTLSALTAILGGPISNLIIPKLGRKIPTFIFAAVATVSWILVAVTRADFMALAYVARAIMGVCVGGLSSLCSMYIVEISPDEVKSSYGTLHQFGVTIGVAYAYLLGIWCSWRLTTYLCGLITLILAIFIWLIPESPAAANVGVAKEEDGEHESLCQRKFVPPMIVAFLMMFFQQFSGINSITTNLAQMFEAANVPLDPSVSALIVGLSQCISTVVASPIIGRFGRRIPFVVSSIGQGLMLLLTRASDLWNIGTATPIVAIFFDFFFFGIGSGPIPWFIVPELFSDSVRHLAVSISTALNWFFAAVTVFIWPEMNSSMGFGWGIFVYAVICVVAAIYGMFWMPVNEQEHLQSLDNDPNDEEAAPEL